VMRAADAEALSIIALFWGCIYSLDLFGKVSTHLPLTAAACQALKEYRSSSWVRRRMKTRLRKSATTSPRSGFVVAFTSESRVWERDSQFNISVTAPAH